MSGDNEMFLDRWSRLKQEQAKERVKEQATEKAPVPAQTTEKAEQPAVALQPVEELNPDSDFVPFMGPKVDDQTRRSALKRLFTDAHFNVPDPFEAYSEDYTGGEPIPVEMLKSLNHARKLLFDDPEKTAEAAAAQSGPESGAAQSESASQELKNAVGKQDA